MGQSDNTKALAELRNIGPRTAARLVEAGIPSVAVLKKMGAVAAYRRLKHVAPRETTIVALYALEGAIKDIPWNNLPKSVRQVLRHKAGA